MTLRQILAEGTAQLRSAGIETPDLDASLLLARLLGTDRTGLVMLGPEPAPEETIRDFRELLRRRLAGECVAYLVGHREFRGLEFAVTPAVLVPRPDTEILVEAALRWIRLREAARPRELPVRVLDVCTGSGAVAVALRHEHPGLLVSASDISPEALEIARRNGESLLTAGSCTGNGGSPGSVITFFESDLLDSVPGRFDLIVSNPPYIPTGVIDTLSPEVRREPRLALDGGPDGLSIIGRLATAARERLLPGGRLLMEADPRQMPMITGILEQRDYGEISLEQDLAGWDRVIGGSIPGP